MVVEKKPGYRWHVFWILPAMMKCRGNPWGEKLNVTELLKLGDLRSQKSGFHPSTRLGSQWGVNGESMVIYCWITGDWMEFDGDVYNGGLTGFFFSHQTWEVNGDESWAAIEIKASPERPFHPPKSLPRIKRLVELQNHKLLQAFACDLPRLPTISSLENVPTEAPLSSEISLMKSAIWIADLLTAVLWMFLWRAPRHPHCWRRRPGDPEVAGASLIAV